MKRKTLYRRPRRSMFDDYKDLIADCISQGMYTKDIAKIISEKFGYEITISGLYYYIKHKTDLKINEMEDDIPRCCNCESCGHVKDYGGKNEYQMCEDIKRIVSRSVHTSPSWCPNRQDVSV